MKNLMLCFAFVAVVSLMLIRVEGASMPKCADQCDTSNCPTMNCECGTVKDFCDCCEFCRKCPNQACHEISSDVCAEGYTCTYPAGADSMFRMTNNGTCLPTPAGYQEE